MFRQCLVVFLLMSNMACMLTSMAVAKVFEKTRYPNGTVTCALDEPSFVIPLDQLSPSLSDGDSCVASGALCAMQCVQDPDCTNYNYRAYPRTCEIYHYTPTTCSPVTGCSHAEVPDLQSCQSPLEEASTISAVTDDWSQDHSVLSSKESTDMLVITTETKDRPIAPATHSAPPTNELNYCLSSTFAIVFTSMSSTKSMTTFSPKPSTTSLEVSSSTSSTTSLEVSSSTSSATSLAVSSSTSSTTFLDVSSSTSSTTPLEVSSSTSSTTFLDVSSSTSSTTPLEVSSSTSSTTAPPTSTTFEVVEGTTTATITIVPPPSITSGNPCDKYLSWPNYVIQVNQGFGLDQDWQAYKNGFSDANGGYYIGNENLYRMTSNGHNWNVCFDVQDQFGFQYYVTYSTFIMDAESAGYTYFATGMQGASLDPLGPDSRKYKFTTKDKNNQPTSCANQAAACKGGWWWMCNGQNMAVVNGAGSCGFKYGLGFGLSLQLKRSYVRISQQ